MTFLRTAHCMKNCERIVDLNSMGEESRFTFYRESCSPIALSHDESDLSLFYEPFFECHEEEQLWSNILHIPHSSIQNKILSTGPSCILPCVLSCGIAAGVYFCKANSGWNIAVNCAQQHAKNICNQIIYWGREREK